MESSLEAADDLRRRAIEVDIARRFSSEQRAVRARNDLLAVVSHDLRGPLSGVLLQTEVMLHATGAGDDAGANVLRSSAERIRRSAAHMKALTDDLLDLASIEANRFTLHLESVESREVIEDGLLAAAPLAQAKRITLAAELIDVPRLEADPERIFRVLSNLLGNAVKFTPDGGTITVRAERRGDDLSIAVADTGPGIGADQLPHIFDRYWKNESTSHSGAGLGLYIANGIVEAHGGKIWAEYSNAGTRFTFTLPLAR